MNRSIYITGAGVISAIGIGLTETERALRAPSLQEQNAFLHRLEQKKISVTRRRALGSEIEGACGQLRRARLSEEKKD